jgi:hypothetical protein
MKNRNEQLNHVVKHIWVNSEKRQALVYEILKKYLRLKNTAMLKATPLMMNKKHLLK